MRAAERALLAGLFATAGCAPGGSTGAGDDADGHGAFGKADDFTECPALDPIAPGESREYQVTDHRSFRAILEQPEGQETLARLVVTTDGRSTFGIGGTRPVVEAVSFEESPSHTLRVENLSHAELTGRLCAQSIDPEPPADGEPRFFVRFTQPACAALPDHDVPAGALCTGDSDEKSFSRAAAGIVDHLEQWIDDATAAAEAGRDVTITMAYLTWSDGRLYDALCRATAAGVRFEVFLDERSGGSQAPRLTSDEACNSENVTLHRLGGVTSYPSWRLMHVKLVAIDDGSGTTRLVFGSANLSSYGTSIHFENWLFAEAPTDSHFVASHRCAIEALREAEAAPYPDDAARFEDAYDACVDALEVEPDPRFQVFFSPDRDRAMLGAVVDAMRAAESRVDLAIQHFSASRLIYQLADNGRDEAIETRLVLDDDTFYDVGESGGNDREWYDIALRDAGIDIRFVQTNSRMQYGKQYQHNKYVLIDDDLVFMGAGNFTDVAFGQNYENFYLLRSPELARVYREHFERLFEIGRPEGDLPPEPVAP